MSLSKIKNLSKIAIWGPPSSGKSTLAKVLAKHLKIKNIIHTDDYLTWNPATKWQFMEKDEFLEIVNPILSKSQWLVEGNLGEHISRNEILDKAECVIILNPSFMKLYFRVISRGLTRNTIIKLGNHTEENATIEGKFSLFDLFCEIKESIRIINNFKKNYIHHLLSLATEGLNSEKVIVIK